MLKKENCFIYFVLNLLTFGLFTFYVAHKLDLYDKDAWYSHWYYWVCGFILGIFPGLVMLLAFSIKMGALVSEKLGLPGKEIYTLPYPWIICLIVPILGWSLFIILYIYTHYGYCFCLEK